MSKGLTFAYIGLLTDGVINEIKLTFILDLLNHFFTTIAANLAAKLPDVSGDFGGPFIDNY